MPHSSDEHRANLWNEDIALLVNDQHIIVGFGSPNSDHNAVSGSDEVIFVEPCVICGGEITLEQIGTEWWKY